MLKVSVSTNYNRLRSRITGKFATRKPRAMLKCPKRSFVVVLVLLGVESSSKNVINGTRNVLEQILFQIEQK